jgi:hydrogenase assembly chaperone HypC/HupF
MCLTLPARLKTINYNDYSAQVDLAGKDRRVRLGFSEAAQSGDWVLVNADLAVAKITSQEAEEINEYLN